MSNHSSKDYVIHGVFYLFYGLVKYIPSPLGDWLRALVLRCFVKKMGSVTIKEGVHFVFPYKLELGHKVSLNAGVTIDASGGVSIGDYCRLAHNVTVLSSDHVFAQRDKPIYLQGLEYKTTRIDEDCWLGCNVTILMGSHLKKGSIVAAHSVVKDTCDEYSILGGVPAKLLKQRP